MCNKMKRLPIFQGETRQGGANRRLSKQKKEDMMDAYLVAINDVVIDAVSDAIKENNEEQELSLQAVSRTVREIFQDLMVSEKTIQALLDPARRAKRYEEIELFPMRLDNYPFFFLRSIKHYASMTKKEKGIVI